MLTVRQSFALTVLCTPGPNDGTITPLTIWASTVSGFSCLNSKDRVGKLSNLRIILSARSARIEASICELKTSLDDYSIFRILDIYIIKGTVKRNMFEQTVTQFVNSGATDA